MAGTNEKHIPDIAAIAAWSELPEALRDTIARILLSNCDLRKVGPGDTWIREGEQTENKGYILLRGTVAIIRDGLPRTECDAPALLGEMMQFNPREHRLATITALTKCTVLRFAWDEFWDASKKEFDEVESATIHKLVERFAWTRFMDWD